jgi:hypothetical protein
MSIKNLEETTMNNDDIRLWGNYRRQASTDAFLEESRLARREAFERDCEREVRQTICMEDTPLPEPVSESVNRKHGHYFKDVSKYREADVYRVCQMFDIDDPSGATQHAIKKLLLAGGRGGGKDRAKDLREAIDTMSRLLEMMKEDEVAK